MFRIGQKVQCIDAEANGQYIPAGLFAKNRDLHRLTLNSVYTVRNVRLCLGRSICRVEEIIRPTDPFFGEEAYFACERFRPLTERKTDISAFRSLLNPTKQQIRESIGLDLGFTLEEIGEE